MIQTIDIQQQLIKERNKKQQSIDVLEWVKEVFEDINVLQKDVLERLAQSPINKTTNTFNIDRVDANAIFHISQIRKICIDFRLRFLDTRYFKADYPQEVISKIKALEKEHNTTLDGFKIIAPSKLFELNEADDPLLFAPMGNGYYYLIHKWGKDMHPLRKVKYWAIKNVENLGVAIFIFSILMTLFTKDFFFKNEINFGYVFMLFLFYVKGIMGFIFLFGVSSGKNFSEYCWLSRYNKIS
ncbi:hypothetical protein [Polaribacter septentrionalilitoris]|uniref:hypothetical protein n=1 Tax=Polaribacter septentrionalilitoris TaxID=2494657 RepID=UPI00135BA6F0|nr:hypothetical protein [Polaribacter septentrionalilitoris]